MTSGFLYNLSKHALKGPFTRIRTKEETRQSVLGSKCNDFHWFRGLACSSRSSMSLHELAFLELLLELIKIERLVMVMVTFTC